MGLCTRNCAGNGTVFAEEKSVERPIKGSINRKRWLGTYLHGAGELDVCAGRDPVQLALDGDLGGDCKRKKNKLCSMTCGRAFQKQQGGSSPTMISEWGVTPLHRVVQKYKVVHLPL